MWRKFEDIFWQVVFIGYVTFGRSFAYVGLSPLFIGETFIGTSLLTNRRRWLHQFFKDLFQLKLIPTAVSLMIGWGIFQCLRSYLTGHIPVLEVAKSFAFNYYPIVIPIGMAIGADMTPVRFVRFFKALTWSMAIYGVAYCALSGMDWMLPWLTNNVAVFNSPLMSPLIAVGILSLWPFLKDWKPKIWLMLLSMAPIFFNPGRGTLLALVIGLACVSLVSVKRAAVIFGCIGTVLIVMLAIGPYLPGAGGRAGSMDPLISVARVVSTFDEKAASGLLTWAGHHEDADEAFIAKETAQWRKDFWRNSLNSLDTTNLILLGHGHGADISPHVPSGGEEIRTPHNIFVFAMFHTGAIGVALLALLIGSLLLAATAVKDPNFRALALAMILMNCMQSLVGDLFETPFGAIPCYLLMGMLIKLPQWSAAQWSVALRSANQRQLAESRGFEVLVREPMIVQVPSMPAKTYR